MILLILWIIAGLIFLAIILSLMPFSVYVKLNASLGDKDNDTGFGYQTAVYWPWNVFGVGFRKDYQARFIQLLLNNWCFYEREMRVKGKKPKKEKVKGFNLLRDRELLSQMIRAVLKFLKDLITCLRRPRLAGNIELGFSDPAAMGIISGFIYAISPNGMALDDLRIRPNYINAIFSGEVGISTGAQPARIIGAFIKLLFRLPKRRLLRLLSRGG